MTKEIFIQRKMLLFDSHVFLNGISFPRNVILRTSGCTIVVFADASDMGYSTVCYIVLDTGPKFLKSMSQIICKKEKLNIGKQSSSHQAMSVHLHSHILEAFPDDDIIRIVHFTKNLATPHWIKT